MHEDLLKSFASTNLIESCFSRTEELIRRVKRWQNGEMFLRWTGAALLFAETGFRHLPKLLATLRSNDLDTQALAK